MSLFNAQAFESALSATLNCNAPRNLIQAMQYSVLSPGKRIRPRIVFATCELLEVSEEFALAPAIAIELIHCFTLIHDDLPCMDNDDFRRGRPSNHKAFGEALALLAGDGLLAYAFDVLLRGLRDSSPQEVLRVCQVLATAAGPMGVIGGQAAESLLDANSTFEQLQAMHAGKTGALFLACVRMPKALAGIDESSEESAALDRFGESLGAAFQVADDLADLDQDPVRAPTSVLYYKDATQAYELARQALDQSAREIQGFWGNRAESLLEISNKILRRK